MSIARHAPRRSPLKRNQNCRRYHRVLKSVPLAKLRIQDIVNKAARGDGS
jgi:hypothetical protein